jgi:hypothetical protein
MSTTCTTESYVPTGEAVVIVHGVGVTYRVYPAAVGSVYNVVESSGPATVLTLDCVSWREAMEYITAEVAYDLDGE